MTKMHPFRLYCALVLLALGLWASPARAYVLPADFLARLWADTRRPSLKDATWTLTLSSGAQDKSQEARLFLKRPERLRWVKGEDGQDVRIVREGQGAQGAPAELTATGPSDDLLGLLMLPRGKDLDETSARIIEGVQGLGVDCNTTTFARHADGVAYIVGAHSWENTRPQLWFDKATFTPVRLVWRGKSTRSENIVWRQLRLLKWTQGWPRLLEWWEDGELVERGDVSAIGVNQNLPETLFDLPGAGARRRER